MFDNRQRLFERRARAHATRAFILIALVALGGLAGRGIQAQFAPRLAFAPEMVAYAIDSATQAMEASITAMVNRDFPLLEEMWGVGGASGQGIGYVEPPRGVRAGGPLRVSVHGTRQDGTPFSGALVELTWQLTGSRYHDVTFTDSRGNVDVSRQVGSECKGKQCVVAVRMCKDGLQALAYTTFVPR